MTYLTAIKRVMKTFVIPSIIVFSTAYECPFGPGSDQNKDKESDTRPTCKKKYENAEKIDMTFCPLYLSYDLDIYTNRHSRWYSDEYEIFKYDIDHELAGAHCIDNVYYSGTINSFNMILSDNAMNFTSEKAPSIEVTMSGIECKGSTTKKFAQGEVLGGTLYNCDPYLLDLASLTYTIKSVTTMHGMQLVWKGTLSSNNGYISLAINALADVYTYGTKAVINTKVGTTEHSKPQVAIRSSKNAIVATRAGAPEYQVVENSIPEGVIIGDVRKSTEEIVISPNLLKGIYIGGKLDETKGWNIPELFEIL